MPDKNAVDDSGLQACPECGHMNPVNSPVCTQCGMELYLDQLGPENFEEFDEGAHDEGPEAEGFEDVIVEDEGPASDLGGRARPPPGRPLPGPPQPARPMAGKPGAPIRLVPPPVQSRTGFPPQPGARPGAVSPPAPAKPAPAAPVDYIDKREKAIPKLTLYLVILGVVNLALTAGIPYILPLAGAYEGVWAGQLVLQLAVMGVLIAFALYTGTLADRSPDKTTLVEEKNISRVTTGAACMLLIFLIQVLGVHRALPGVPDPGNYNTGWSILYIGFTLLALIMFVKGLYAIREKLSYYKIWRFGIWILVLAPATGAIDALSPVAVATGTTILNYQSYFAYSVSALFLVLTFMAIMLKDRLGEMYRSLEEETKRGEELFKLARYKEANERFDTAIDLGHELFSQYFYDPYSSRMSQVRLPSQYGIPWLRKGDIFVQLRRPRKAIAIYDVIIELDPRNEVVWNRKGEVLLSMGKFQDAIRCFDSALSAVPTYTKASQNKAKAAALMAKAAEDGARPVASTAVKVD